MTLGALVDALWQYLVQECDFRREDFRAEVDADFWCVPSRRGGLWLRSRPRSTKGIVMDLRSGDFLKLSDTGRVLRCGAARGRARGAVAHPPPGRTTARARWPRRSARPSTGRACGGGLRT